MKIVFFSIVSYPYVSDYGYQDNGLAQTAAALGDQVVEISTNYIPNFLKRYISITPEFLEREYTDKYNVKIYRVKYKYPFLGNFLNWRIRAYSGIQEILEKEKPQIIFVHDLQEWSLFYIAEYLRKNPDCVGYADLHCTYVNSCRNFISKYIQHRVFYRYIIRKNIDAFKKVFYLAEDTLTFFETEYAIKLPKEKTELLPIGGIVSPPENRLKVRQHILEELNLPEESLIIVHSGKLEPTKRTKELLEAFRNVPDEVLQLIIVGRIPEYYEKELKTEIEKDERVHFLGWKTAKELQDYLIAADLYAQPGTASSTLNSALCCGCPVMLSPQKSKGEAYRTYLDSDKVFFIDTIEDMTDVLKKIVKEPVLLSQYREYSYEYAHSLLDYRRQIEMIKSYK